MSSLSSPGFFNNRVVAANNIDLTGNENPSETMLLDGQLLIAHTALNATGSHIDVGKIIAADASITMGYVFPNITIKANSLSSFSWTDVSGAFSPINNNGYFITGTATGTLPAGPSQGDTIKFFVDHASQVLTIKAAGTQIIRLGSLVSSAGGTFVSTLQGDSVELVYRANDTCWCAIAGFSGTWTLT